MSTPLPVQVPLFPELLPPEQARTLRIQQGREALWAWIRGLPDNGTAHSTRWIVMTEVGRLSMVTRGESGPGSPYHPQRLTCIRHIKNALQRGVDSRREEAYQRWETGKQAVSRGDFDALGQAVFGHLRR